MSSEGYQRWRAKIPFTDGEISAALLAEAEGRNGTHRGSGDWLIEAARRCRAGWVSNRAVTEAAPRLVTKCGLCGKTALYRVDWEGRCSAHRFVPAGTRGDTGRGRLRACVERPHLGKV